MFEFVNWLRVIAAVLITNSHYADIWPVSALAFGGHIGNCIYFFLSGFCLYNIKEAFPKWYLRRIIRIYPALWIVNIVDLIARRTHIGEFTGFLHCFFYPTWFHFIGSIMLLYALYYIITYAQHKLKFDIRWIMLATLIIFIILYIFCFDKSTYHIDDVNEKWVRFMFFESMLLGAWLREKYDRIESKITTVDIGLFCVFTVIYLAGKILLSRLTWLSIFQCFLPVILVIYIYSIATIFIKFEKKSFFTTLNDKVNAVIGFISEITLEIYLGQSLVIWVITDLIFPISFLVITVVILLYAWIIHVCSSFVQKKIFKLLQKIRSEINNNE